MSLYAIGDIHGCADKLNLLLNKITPLGSYNKIIFLGDYIDCGPDSKKVIQMILFLQKYHPEQVICLMGNHEDTLLKAIDLGDEDSQAHFAMNGGIQTLKSYCGQYDNSQWQDLGNNFPPSHLEFFRNLKSYHQENGYIFVHGGLRPNVPLEQQDPLDMMWMHKEFIRSEANFGGIVVFGHTPHAEPLVMHNKICIDTGAVFNGKLTALKIDGDDLEFISV